MPEPSALELQFTLNGESVSLRIDPRDRLLDVLRYALDHTGTKEGCGEGECGACSVWLDGLPVNSCLVPALQVRGRDVRTIEAVAPERLQALLESGATQCGACTPGVVMTALWVCEQPEMLERFPARQLMAGNLCRCTGYDGIIEGLEATLAATDEEA